MAFVNCQLEKMFIHDKLFTMNEHFLIKGSSRMKKRTGIACLLTAAIVLGSTGCVGKSTGGALTRQGMEAIETLDYSGALEKFQQAVTDEEDAVPALRGLGLAYMGMAQYAEAAEAFDEALDYTDEKMPETIRDLLLYKASAQFRLKDYEKTVETCDELLQQEAETADAYYFRGACYLAMGYQDRAKTDFDQAAALEPKDYNLYLNIYESYKSQKLSALGDEYLQTALNIPPQKSEDYYCIGQIYYYLEQYEQAQNALITPMEEKYLPALQLMGRIYLAQEDYAHAKAMYETIQQEAGESQEICNGLALCCLASGEYEQALQHIEQGLSMETGTAKQELLFNEIVVYEKLLDFTTAKIKAENYVNLYPTDEAGQKEYTFLKTR